MRFLGELNETNQVYSSARYLAHGETKSSKAFNN